MLITKLTAPGVLLATLLLTVSAAAQVLPPDEIRDLSLREMQKKYLTELKGIADAARAHHFPFQFYFSRKLGLAEKDQKQSDQRSVQFDKYKDRTVLKITGNYFAAYSAEQMTAEERARQTYEDVILPLLQAAVPALAKADAFQDFAFEISHHVRKKVLEIWSESTENMVLILPKEAAQRLVASTDPAARQAAVLEGEAFLNTVSVALWPRPLGQPAKTPTKATSPAAPSNSLPPVPAAAVAVAPARQTSPEALKSIQDSYQTSLDRLVQELDAQGHFVRYAPPAFISFRDGLYLQLSLTTALTESDNGSQYKLAALAFDQHIAHLIRPVLQYFKEDLSDFDGIDFSTSVRLGAGGSSGGQVAVEFVFPLNMLRAYARFDCTGQQLIDAGVVLINGERVGLNLEIAEAGVRLP